MTIASTLLDQVEASIAQAVDALAAEFPDGRDMAEYLIHKQVWDHLTTKLGLGPVELREKADENEEEAADEIEDEAADEPEAAESDEIDF